ncbi:MAG: hypothetical protein AAB305_05710, partial [Candidatus Zixiibacteriota bacterium]
IILKTYNRPGMGGVARLSGGFQSNHTPPQRLRDYYNEAAIEYTARSAHSMHRTSCGALALYFLRPRLPDTASAASTSRG